MASDAPPDGLLLGRSSPAPTHYSPEVLYPVERGVARRGLGLEEKSLPFRGEDVWNAWELSWLGPDGCPQCAVARIRIPCESPVLVESKSLKLYLNSLNQQAFSDEAEVGSVIARDLSDLVGVDIGIELLMLQDERLSPQEPPGDCIDGEQPLEIPAAPDAGVLFRSSSDRRQQVLYSHLLRSLCPVTAQPDWATVIVKIEGAPVREDSLLTYLLGFREHQEFHEQCVERIFLDILSALEPNVLEVQALYTRRGGIDINPFRSTERDTAPWLRTYRQ
jgi:7-cyano-7-deazaguanine reductase